MSARNPPRRETLTLLRRQVGQHLPSSRSLAQPNRSRTAAAASSPHTPPALPSSTATISSVLGEDDFLRKILLRLAPSLPNKSGTASSSPPHEPPALPCRRSLVPPLSAAVILSVLGNDDLLRKILLCLAPSFPFPPPSPSPRLPLVLLLLLGSFGLVWFGPVVLVSCLIGFIDSKDVRIHDITLNQLAYWCLHLVRCDNSLIHNVSIYGYFDTPNNDGIDIEDSNNTLITDCHIDTRDDAICPKSTTGPVYNLMAANCWVRTKSCAIKFGSASTFDFKRLVLDNITIVDSHRGLGMQIRDGVVQIAEFWLCSDWLVYLQREFEAFQDPGSCSS